jgi:hypothetical protein
MDLLFAGWLTFGTLQGADLATTHAALRRGAVETNAIMRQPLPVQIAIKAGATAALVAWSRKHPKAGKIVVWSLNGLYAGIVIHNARTAARR